MGEAAGFESLELSSAASEDEFVRRAVLFATRPWSVAGRVWAAGEGLIWRSKRVVGWLVEVEVEAEAEVEVEVSEQR